MDLTALFRYPDSYPACCYDWDLLNLNYWCLMGQRYWISTYLQMQTSPEKDVRNPMKWQSNFFQITSRNSGIKKSAAVPGSLHPV